MWVFHENYVYFSGFGNEREFWGGWIAEIAGIVGLYGLQIKKQGASQGCSPFKHIKNAIENDQKK